MFRELRRKKQILTLETTENILKKGTTGILGVIGDHQYPYTVPLNYVYKDQAIYFHCAKSGHKLDAIRNNSKVSFCVIDKDQIVPEEFTTYFRSVIAFGQAIELTDETDKYEAMQLLNKKYAPTFLEAGDNEIQREWSRLMVVKIKVEHMTGKEAIELVRQK